jgi:hypothetical protein
MKQNMGEVVTRRVETPELVVESQGEPYYRTLMGRTFGEEIFRQWEEATKLVIFNNEVQVVPEEGIAVDVGIGYQASEEDPQAGGEKPLARNRGENSHGSLDESCFF